jgi:hypothetical protein
MLKMETGKVGGLSPRELEAHSRAELLPDRIEMHRRKSIRKKRIRKKIGNVECDGGNNTCQRINT